MTNEAWNVYEENLADNNNNNNDDTSARIEVDNNRIYFYNNVNKSTILKLNKALRTVYLGLVTSANNLGLLELPPIYIYINSSGGIISDGFAGLSTILEYKQKVPIYTIVEGTVASAATMLSVVGTKRFIRPYSKMMIHQLSGIVVGQMEKLEESMTNKRLLMKEIKTVYKEYTEVPMAELDEILKHDLLFDVEKCLEYKLVDEILI